MPYILSTLSNSQDFPVYVQRENNFKEAVKHIIIQGGANVTNKHFIVPQGVITKVSNDELEYLKSQKAFQRLLERGHLKYYGNSNPNIEKEAPKMEKDKSRQLTPEDFRKAGKKAPKVEKD
jgi:hypothetical protein